MTNQPTEGKQPAPVPSNESHGGLPAGLQETAEEWHPYLRALLERVRAVTDKS